MSLAEPAMTESEVRPLEAKSQRWRLSTGRAVALLFGLTILFYSPILSGRWTFPDGDFTNHFLPFSQHLADSWRSLSLPIWNPYTYSGHPFWADVQAAALYPVSNLLLLVTLPLTNDATRLYILELDAFLHVFMAGIFAFLLMRELTDSGAAAILASISFMFSGYLTGYPPLQLAVLRTAVWLPLLLWLLLRAWRQPESWRYWIAAGIVFAIAFLAGHTQTWMFIAYSVAGWIIALWLSERSSVAASDVKPLTRMHWFGVMAFGGIALGLMAAQLLPSVEYARLTVRAQADYAYLSGGFPLRDTWQVILPGVFTQFSPLYVGVISLGLAFFAIIDGWGRRIHPYAKPVMGRQSSPVLNYSLIGYFAILTVVSLLISYGDNGFLYRMLYRIAPGFDLFRGQERIAYLVTFGLSICAGYGLAFAPRATRRFRKRFALLFGGAITAAVYAFGLLWQLPGSTVISDWHFLGLAVGTLALAMTLAVVLWLDGWSWRRDVVLCALVALTLFTVNMTTTLILRTPAQAVIRQPEIVALQDAMLELSDPTGLPTRAYNEFRVYENYGMRSGVEDVWGSSPLRLLPYNALFDEFPLDRMFRLTGVGHLLTWRKELFEPSELLAEFPQAEDTTYLHRLEQVNPRMWIVSNLIVEDDQTAVKLLADHEFNLEETAIIADEIDAVVWRSEPNAAKIGASSLRPGAYSVHVTNSEGGILMVSENWLPGWRVENVECPTSASCEQIAHASGLELLKPVRANLTLLAIPLPEGDTQFDLIYAPASIRVGLLISGFTLAVIAFVAAYRIVAVRRSNR